MSQRRKHEKLNFKCCYNTGHKPSQHLYPLTTEAISMEFEYTIWKKVNYIFSKNLQINTDFVILFRWTVFKSTSVGYVFWHYSNMVDVIIKTVKRRKTKISFHFLNQKVSFYVHFYTCTQVHREVKMFISNKGRWRNRHIKTIIVDVLQKVYRTIILSVFILPNIFRSEWVIVV